MSVVEKLNVCRDCYSYMIEFGDDTTDVVVVDYNDCVPCEEAVIDLYDEFDI